MKKPTDKQSEAQANAAELQFEQLFRELETDEGRKKLGDEAYKEAMAAKARGSIHPKPLSK